MYSLGDFGKMICDGVRVDAYAEALRQSVTPASVVLDIGAGTGILSLLACKAGARRVYAIEPSSAIELLAESARDNGFADRITILRGRSADITLPERADVIVSDIRGILPPHQTNFADIIDARRRLLAPGGTLIPARDTVFIAVVAAPQEFQSRRQPWAAGLGDLVLRSALRYVDNSTQKHRARREDLLSEPLPWAEVDYPTLDKLSVRGAASCTIVNPGTAHGLLLWFDTTLIDGVGYSNSPGAPVPAIYGQSLFCWPEAVELRAGDRVLVDLRADPIAGEYCWTWATRIVREAGPPASQTFKQSTIGSMVISPEVLRRRSPEFIPKLSSRGWAALEVLEGIRAGRTVGELASMLEAGHPDRFASLDAAKGFVASVVERYAE